MPSLWTKSNFSFLEGASRPEELMAQAAAQGLSAVALTDRNGLYGVVRAHRAAQALGIKLIIGAEVAVSEQRRVVLLAADLAGYQTLCQLLSLAQVDHPKGQAQLPLADLCDALQGPGDLLCLCPEVELLARLAKEGLVHGRLYALVARSLLPEEPAQEAYLTQVASRLKIPVVAAVEVLYHAPARRAVQDVLTCIRHGTTLAQAGTRLRPNAEHALPAASKLAALFADQPDWLNQAQHIADRCTFSLDQLRYRYPAGNLPAGVDGPTHLRQRVLAGARERYGDHPPAHILHGIDHELGIINTLDYGGYFLTMQEIVLFCRRNQILCQGRGSAANSVVCFCLGITAVDPANMQLLFERFLSVERAEPPDIDLDIEHHRREEVIQWVYAHYGRRHAAMVANVVRFRLRSAIREVGNVLGLAAPALDALARQVGHAQGAGPATATEGFTEPIAWPVWLAHAGLDPAQASVQHLIRLCTAVLDYPRHLSVHPGGFLLGDAPIDTLCAVEPATMPGRTVVQWDKQDIEDLGLFKVDLLGLGALSHIHQAFTWVARTTGEQLTMANVPQEDSATYAMIQRAETLGVFQIESRAQMAMLPRLLPKTFYDLVVEVAIVRPGPIQGDMVHPYLKARALGHKPTYPHPAFAQILDKTFGVPIFQEQVMRLAILAANYTPYQADELRRDMAAWRSTDRLETHHARIVAGMMQKGVPQEFAERIFAQIRGFGEYGFPESHAASFAHIVYVTAYLRCHHPEAFTCALLNAQPMGFYTPATIIEEARRRNMTFLPIALGQSAWDCTVVATPMGPTPWAIRMGLRYVRGLGVREREQLAAVPATCTSLQTLVEATPLHRGALCALARAGALDHLQHASGPHAGGPGSQRRALLAEVRGLIVGRHDTLWQSAPQGTSRALLGDENPWSAPLSVGEQILWERKVSGHSTLGHPLAAWRARLTQAGIVSAVRCNDLPHGARVKVVGLSICLQRPQTARGVTFITLEDETGLVNVVVWLDVFARFGHLIKTAPLLAVTAKVQREGDVLHLIAQSIAQPAL